MPGFAAVEVMNWEFTFESLLRVAGGSTGGDFKGIIISELTLGCVEGSDFAEEWELFTIWC